MAIRIGINGFGRIGRTITRIMRDKGGFDIVGINDLTAPDQLAHSLKYDSIYGHYPAEVAVEGDGMRIGGCLARITALRDPAELDWASLNVDFVLECTGRFKKRTDLQKHIDAGAPKVLLSVPPKEALDATVVLGVNDHVLTGKELMVSNASCTTNAAAPIAKIINDAFGIQRGYINTIHAYTNDQHLKDMPHDDWRRSRSAPLSIIPTSTGAAKAVGKVIPALDGKLDGVAYRVPVPDGSIADMLFEVGRDTTITEVNDVVRTAAEGDMKGIVEFCTDPVVSIDIIRNYHSSIFDSLLTQVINNRWVKVASWYDNEWGYSARMVDLVQKIVAMNK